LLERWLHRQQIDRITQLLSPLAKNPGSRRRNDPLAKAKSLTLSALLQSVVVLTEDGDRSDELIEALQQSGFRVRWQHDDFYWFLHNRKLSVARGYRFSNNGQSAELVPPLKLALNAV
jgi:hypothetical protein